MAFLKTKRSKVVCEHKAITIPMHLCKAYDTLESKSHPHSYFEPQPFNKMQQM